MAINEFELIARYFTHTFPKRSDVILGVGDDAAICQIPNGMELVISVDTLVEGVHFPKHTSAEDIGYKALAVNLSDMAAMGATPAWMTLALTCPQVDENWLHAFTQGLLSLAEPAQVSLIGGDTTRGTLTITIQIMGFVSQGTSLRRYGASPGDGIYVTGYLGDAGFGLACIQHSSLVLPTSARHYLESRLNRPTPRYSEGQILRNIASSAIDISDGLAADLNHILLINQVGASINIEQLPLSKPVIEHFSREAAWQTALSAGDDYELCFTVPPAREQELSQLLTTTPCTRIGTVESERGLRIVKSTGEFFPLQHKGYQHF